MYCCEQALLQHLFEMVIFFNSAYLQSELSCVNNLMQHLFEIVKSLCQNGIDFYGIDFSLDQIIKIQQNLSIVIHYIRITFM